ncbi:hypothetical protein KP509_36G048800 [Ceratopteris richardii]|uniref:PHD-type domain-containing protein n=1 Tax=Ceratopteris richardii TaxID=49495 RepID=A0A8T2QE43_CERRI|nr:hypothetical protein KP509_36G048800 [Ceratopteris richardii]
MTWRDCMDCRNMQTMDYYLAQDSNERFHSPLKRKASNEGFILHPCIEGHSSKRRAVREVSDTIHANGNIHVPHNSRSRECFMSWMKDDLLESHPSERRATKKRCLIKHFILFMSSTDQIWFAIGGRVCETQEMLCFFQSLLKSSTFTSFIDSVSMDITLFKVMPKSLMDISSNYVHKGDDNGNTMKDAPTAASGGKHTKDSNHKSTEETKGEDSGDAGKDSENDDSKEIGEKGGKEDGEGGEEGKDKEKPEQETEEEEEEEQEREEESKEDEDIEMDSGVCTVTASPIEEALDCSTLSDGHSHHSDDIYNGQEGLSSRLEGGSPFALSDHLAAAKLKIPGVSCKADADMDTSNYSTSRFSMSDGSASLSMQNGSHRMQNQSDCHPPGFIDVSGQGVSDIPRDVFSNVFNSGSSGVSRNMFGDAFSIQGTSSYGSHSLQPVLDTTSGWQTPSEVSKDICTDGSVSHNQQSTSKSSSLPQARAELSHLMSSGASKDCRAFNQMAQPERLRIKIKLPKDPTGNLEPPGDLEDGSGEEVLSKLKEVKDFPTTAKGLLSSGLLDGCKVHYYYKGRGNTLTGVVKDGGILCNCRLCKGKVVVNVSSFEKHAGSNARHPSDYIFLENGKSLQEIIKAGCQSNQGRSTGTVFRAANEEGTDRSSIRTSGVRGSSTHSRKGSFSSSEGVKLDTSPLYSRSFQKQPAQTRDGSRHKLLFQPGGLPDGTEVSYYVKGQCYLRGTKKGHGICCGCCNEVVSCSQFEAHAGWASRRNAYISMYLSNGQSLHEYALTLGTKDQYLKGGDSCQEHEDFCAECGDGGDLVLCHLCPKAYHLDCVGLNRSPEHDWCCPLCGEQRQHPWKRTAKGSGRVYYSSSKEKNAERCHRVIKVPENVIGGCVFCKNGDFQKSGFGPKTIMLCDQCEREYHVGCMKERGIADLQELPAGKWFCSSDCDHIHRVLEKLVINAPSMTLKGPDSENGEITWQLLHGRRGNPDNGRMLAEAASIFTESFDPIIDATSGRDLISLMVYSRSIRDQDFQGMYCAVLKHRKEVVSAALFRVFGREFAEMPLVATAFKFRGQGYFQMLMSCIEELLHKLQVKYLVLPAAEGAEGIWTNKFGFSKLVDGQLQRLGSEVQMMIFQGSSMLCKALL